MKFPNFNIRFLKSSTLSQTMILILCTGSDICMAWNPICLGKVHGVIGKMKIHPGIPLFMNIKKTKQKQNNPKTDKPR